MRKTANLTAILLAVPTLARSMELSPVQKFAQRADGSYCLELGIQGRDVYLRHTICDGGPNGELDGNPDSLNTSVLFETKTATGEVSHEATAYSVRGPDSDTSIIKIVRDGKVANESAGAVYRRIAEQLVSDSASAFIALANEGNVFATTDGADHVAHGTNNGVTYGVLIKPDGSTVLTATSSLSQGNVRVSSADIGNTLPAAASKLEEAAEAAQLAVDSAFKGPYVDLQLDE